ncbi:DUF3179 domain-containing protein [Algisphaera agarilytica]|uniref:DUF3179 domain-containing protein n=1 Tax=Algisphaera agarilytica TaxID=1385975 RepID=A0A7X0H6T1_9BACT|nr:DUF3179 domain-containing protein [Algisphaera agarilytica]MBB6430346.1 hypothetical protein [Algisphaera agarilytica]
MDQSTSHRFSYGLIVLTLVVAVAAFYGGWWAKGYVVDPPEIDVTPLFAEGEIPDAPEVTILVADAPELAEGELPLDAIFALQTNNSKGFEQAVEVVRDGWRPGYLPMLLETARFSRHYHRQWMSRVIDDLSGQNFEGDSDRAWRWAWAQDYEPHPHYGLFKARLYQELDPRFAAYFEDDTQSATIRLDEVRWGGVQRDGIPPLKNPEMVTADAKDAAYLDDDNVVFGIELNGDARAYPKRILAWHEMFKDTFGPEDNPVSINGVYCTLCGSMIVYDTVVDGTHHELGTSGFLYRSNKLMYDHATESMWSTLTGEPVIGPLVGQGIKLKPLHVVTTTWGVWKKKHPDTTVLTLNTGHRRDYGEGVAYRSYFATDRLMFTVPQTDNRLFNKDEILALRFGGDDAPPTAVDTLMLADTPVFQGTLGDTEYVVLTDPSGANRVYESGGLIFEQYSANDTATTRDGRVWQVTEDALTTADGQTLSRLAAHRAFWFGWYSAHPDTELIQ